MNNEIEYDEEYMSYPDVGRYKYMRSSEKPIGMLKGKKADYNQECNCWFESFGGGFCCWRDARALQEADDFDLMEFHHKRPYINCKESFFELEYGKTEDTVSRAFFFLQEYAGRKDRSFSFCLYDISLQEANEHIAALEEWHCTGELNVGPYSGIPEYEPWKERE